MVRATPLLAASSLVLLSGGASGLSSTKVGTTRHRSSIISPTRSTGLASKFAGRRIATVANNRRGYWRSDTRLTSTHVEAKHVRRRPLWWFSWLQLHGRSRPLLLRGASEMLRGKKGSRRIVLSVILAAIVVFAP